MRNIHPGHCTVRPGARQAMFALSLVPWSAMWASPSPLDTLQPGQWYEVPNSKLNAINPCPANNCSYSGVSGQVDVMNGWSGAAYDTTRDRLIVWGGGHAGYGGNELYVFDLNTLSWARLTTPTELHASDRAPPNPTTYYHDGTPSARHTYNYLAYAPNVDLFFSLAAGGTYGPSGKFSQDVDSFNFATGTWRTDWPDTPNGGGIGAVSAYDPLTKTLWYHGCGIGTLNQFDPSASQGNGAWNSYPRSKIYLQIYGTAAIDSKRHRMVLVGGYGGKRQMYVWDLNNPNAAPISPVTSGDAGGMALEKAQAPGFVYDPINDQFVAWNGGSTLYTLHPGVWVWTKVNPAASNTVTPSAANAAGTYGRFQYIPSKNAFLAVNRTSENVFIYKLQ